MSETEISNAQERLYLLWQLIAVLQVATSEAARPLVSAHAAVASVLVGLTTATILFCSHFHQMAGDKAAGKKSPIVRLGSTARALRVRNSGQSMLSFLIMQLNICYSLTSISMSSVQRIYTCCYLLGHSFLQVLQWIVAGTYTLALAAILRGGLPWTTALLFPCSIPLVSTSNHSRSPFYATFEQTGFKAMSVFEDV